MGVKMNKFRDEEKCVCCEESNCSKCDCKDLEKQIQKEKNDK
jgi:hypothetical protein